MAAPFVFLYPIIHECKKHDACQILLKSAKLLIRKI